MALDGDIQTQRVGCACLLYSAVARYRNHRRLKIIKTDDGILCICVRLPSGSKGSLIAEEEQSTPCPKDRETKLNPTVALEKTLSGPGRIPKGISIRSRNTGE